MPKYIKVSLFFSCFCLFVTNMLSRCSCWNGMLLTCKRSWLTLLVLVWSYIHTKLGYWQNRSLSTRRGENTSESWSSVWLACRNGESSRIFREEKDWTTRPRSCWRITARNESAWTTRYRSCANETWALSDAQTPHLASLGHSAGRVIIDPSSLFVSKITVKVMGFRLLQNGSYLPG